MAEGLEYTGPGHFRKIAPGVTGADLAHENGGARKPTRILRMAARSKRAAKDSWSEYGPRRNRKKR